MCEHRDLEYLGRQKTEGGYNEYFRCKGCGAVLVFTPRGSAFKIGGKTQRAVSQLSSST